MDKETLKGTLEETMRERGGRSSFEDWGGIQKAIGEIVDLAKDGHYQVYEGGGRKEGEGGKGWWL